jgi:GTPase SAR1 family protein
MKKAVIVVGSHHVGKSTTINQYFKGKIFKGKIELSKRKRKFLVNGCEGYILSQSLEEKGLDEVASTVEKYGNYEKLIFSARPENEILSYYKDLKKQLEKKKFVVETVEIIGDQKESYYKEKAEEIYRKLM